MADYDRQIFELIRNRRISWLQMTGRSTVVGAETILVIFRDENGDILWCRGVDVPTLATSGYGKGCIFVKTDAGAGVPGVYENIGTSTSCNFSVESATPGEIALAEGNVIRGGAGGAGEALDASTDTFILVGDGTTVQSVEMTGVITITNAGVTSITALSIVNADIATLAAIAWSKMAATAANTAIVNATAGAAVPTAVALGASTVLCRLAAGNIVAAKITGAEIDAAAAIALTQLAAQAALTFTVNATNAAAAPTALALAANQILAVTAGPLIGALAIARKTVLGASATVLTTYALAAGDLLTATADDLAAVSIAAGEVVVGATGPVIDGVALPTLSILVGQTGATPVALALAVNEVYYATAAGALAALSLPRKSLLSGAATQLAAYAVAAGDIVTADANDIAVVSIAAGEVVVGATGPAIDGVALPTLSILVGQTGATPVALALAVNEVYYATAAGALAALSLPRKSVLSGAATQLAAYALAAGDLLSADASDVVAISIAAGEVVVGATGPVIDGVALPTLSILVGQTGATPVALALAVNEVYYATAAGALAALSLPRKSVLSGAATQLAAYALAAGDLLSADANDVVAISIAAGEVVVGATGPAIDGVALADNTILTGATGATPVALAVAASRVVGRTAAGVLDDIQIDNTHLLENIVHQEQMYVNTKTTEATDGAITITDAYILAGYIEKTNLSGPQNATLDATADILAVMGAATGSWMRLIFMNSSGQNVTIVAGDGNTTLRGTAVIPTTKAAIIYLIRTAADTIDAVIVLSA